jgi:hypothetical protein
MSTCAFPGNILTEKTLTIVKEGGPRRYTTKILAYVGLMSKSKTHVVDSYSLLRPQSATQCQFPCLR